MECYGTTHTGLKRVTEEVSWKRSRRTCPEWKDEQEDPIRREAEEAFQAKGHFRVGGQSGGRDRRLQRGRSQRAKCWGLRWMMELCSRLCIKHQVCLALGEWSHRCDYLSREDMWACIEKERKSPDGIILRKEDYLTLSAPANVITKVRMW